MPTMATTRFCFRQIQTPLKQYFSSPLHNVPMKISVSMQPSRFVTIYHSKAPLEQGVNSKPPIEDEKYLADLQRGVQQAHKEGDYEEALKLAIHAQKEMKSYFGIDHPVNASAWNNIAIMNKKLGYYDAAIDAYLKAIHTYRNGAGEKHPQYITTLSNLGLCFQSAAISKKKSLEKLPFLERAYETFEEVLKLREENEISYSDNGSSHKNTLAQAKHHLSLVTFYLDIETKNKHFKKNKQNDDNHQSSEEILKEAIDRTEEYLQTLKDRFQGKQNTEVATALNNLGFLYKSGGQYDQSQPCYEEALFLRKKLLGDIHPETILCKNNLAELFLALDKKEEALILQTEILEGLGVDDSEGENDENEYYNSDENDDEEKNNNENNGSGGVRVGLDIFDNKTPMQ